MIDKMKYYFPNYVLKCEFTPGTYSENDWALGETACVDRAFYVLPNGSEYTIYKFAERTHTGRKKIRWEVWHNGRFLNNYFTNFEDAASSIQNEIAFFGFPGNRQEYRIY